MPAAPVSSICGRSTARPALSRSSTGYAVLGDAGPVAQREVLQLPARAQPHPLDIGRFHVGRGPHMHVAGRAVDDDRIARIGDAGGVGDLADGGDAKRARDDRDMRVRSAFFQHQPAQAFAVVFEQRGRAHGARHDHRVLRQAVSRRRVVFAEQLVHQPVRQFVEIVQALAQIGIGRAQHAGAGVRLHALDRGFGGQAGDHGFGAGGAASRGHRRTCDRLPARRDARRHPAFHRARESGRGRSAWSRSRLRGASSPC